MILAPILSVMALFVWGGVWISLQVGRVIRQRPHKAC